jgi:hypothetical protein
MKIVKNILLLFIVGLAKLSGYSQSLPLGGWRAHLPWNNGVGVADAGDKIYCAAENGLFSYNKSDNSLEVLSKVNGLSDKGLAFIKHDAVYNMLFIAYENSNIDLLFANQITNITDIQRKNIVGSKAINDVIFVDHYAYLACGFGIVVLDLDRMEIKDTYYIGPNGGNINVSSVAFDGSDLFASTDSGVYRININNPFINIYSYWTRILTISSGIKYSQIVHFNNRIYLKVDPTNNNDYILVYDYTNWTNSGISLNDMQRIQVAAGKLVVSASSDIKVYDTSQEIRFVNSSIYQCWIKDATFDNSDNLWIADYAKGLVKVNSALQVEYFLPDGPRSKKSAEIKIVNNQLWVAHSLQGRKWASSYAPEGFSTFVDGHWTTFDRGTMGNSIVSLDSLFDFMSLDVDPRNSSHVYFGSRGRGVLEIENNIIKNYYNKTNSTLQDLIGFAGFCAMGGVKLDSDYNLWAVNSTVYAPLSVLKKDGTWQAYSFPVSPGYLDFSVTNLFAGELLIDSYDQKWIDFNEAGILVFDDKAGKYRFLNSEEGKGHLPNNDVRAMVEDRDGQVWVGTAEGVAVFYNPSSILTGSNFDAQQVLLFQGENYQYLLETEVVTSIAVDGANRKWFGTESSGVFLMSADGTKQILHFTEDNSPLLADNISAIAINQETGEVFFGTERGICSYRGDATEGGETCEDYYVFPNPIGHDYHGPIAIQGLVANASVKITDVSGQVVYQTKAKGGLATWDGNNFSGERAKTGVYLVYVTNEDGTATCVTKMLFSN